MYLFKMAFRNIWRNKRRTLITATSIMFAALLTISLTSIETGMWEKMLNSMVEQTTGHIQLQTEDYFDEPVLDHAFSLSKETTQKLLEDPAVLQVNPRLQNFVLSSFEERTRPVLITGVYPQREAAMTGLDEKIIAGEYLTDEPCSGILVGEGIFNRMGLNLGDSLVFIGQGYRGAFAVGMMPVKGVLKFPLSEMNNQLVFTNMADASELFQAYGQYTGVLLMLGSMRGMKAATPRINQLLQDYQGLRAYEWPELMPELIQAKEVDEASTLLTMYILYLVVSFGIFGTLLMLLNERKREMGVLLSIGMKRAHIMLMVWMEFMLMAVLGLVVAMALSYILLSYLTNNPISLGESMQEAFDQFGMEAVLTATLNPYIFLRELMTVSVIVTLLSLYSLWKILRMNPLQAMRS
ncbi:ABC transporter permease [Lunatibacter salilacus]|uniref:ABC transporter permease n=1 Tax=Lunatibacter salilacus TaxID=2483804 RepID=UPI00131CA01C|nr:FtsX-like permease family protein [Lunatibacter salilacus]